MIDKNLLKKDFDEYLAELTDGEKPTAPQLHDTSALHNEAGGSGDGEVSPEGTLRKLLLR